MQAPRVYASEFTWKLLKLISIFKLNPADFGRTWVTRWSEVDADSGKVAHLGAGGVCKFQI
jgi:hypothetical protein